MSIDALYPSLASDCMSDLECQDQEEYDSERDYGDDDDEYDYGGEG